MLNNDTDMEWDNFTTSLGLTQLISEPTRVTNDSKTLIDHIYTNNENNIQSVNVEKNCISDHHGFFCNRSTHVLPDKNDEHQTITYRSFKHFDESCFLNELSTVPREIIENFETLFTEILDKHAPIKNHRIKRNYQPGG